MPVDPRTGQNLPYPGEPGYEEAVQAPRWGDDAPRWGDDAPRWRSNT